MSSQSGSQRSVYLNEAFYSKKLAFREKMIGIYDQGLADPATTPDHRQTLAFNAFRLDLELLITRYSAGQPIANMREQFPRVAHHLTVYVEEPGIGAYHIDKHIDKYSHGLWLVSLGTLLGASDATWQQILPALDSTGKDAVFDRLVALRSPSVRPRTDLLHPKPYRHLIEALDGGGDKRAAAIGKFLDTWYKSMKNAYWHDGHEAGDPAFFGYWCWELAAFVKAHEIDDSSFASHPNYPRDVVR